MDVLKRSRDSRPEKRRGRGGPLFWIGGAILVAASFWMSGGGAMFRAPAAALAAGGSLGITSFAAHVKLLDGRTVIIVDGKAGNSGSHAARLRPLAVTVEGRDGGRMLYHLGTDDRMLAAGGSILFSGRLDAPKDGVESVSVSLGGDE